MVMAFEDEFAVEIPDAEAEKISTVEQAVAYIAAHPQANGIGVGMKTKMDVMAADCKRGFKHNSLTWGRNATGNNSRGP
eukprot:3029984-Rhodomonas_salina.2